MLESDPAPPELNQALELLRPLARIHSPVFLGWDNIPDDRPLLFVGNHTLLGFLDAPLLFRALWSRNRIFLRALGDRSHFRVPGWRHLLHRYGVVEGTPEHCARLFRENATVLVFPGGAREVCKRHGETHRLIWKQRVGFARIAIAHGVPIVPFAALGVEDALDIVADADDYRHTAWGSWPTA